MRISRVVVFVACVLTPLTGWSMPTAYRAVPGEHAHFEGRFVVDQTARPTASSSGADVGGDNSDGTDKNLHAPQQRAAACDRT